MEPSSWTLFGSYSSWATWYSSAWLDAYRGVCSWITNDFDPHPVSLQTTDPVALENFRYNLLSLGQPSGLLTVKVPSTNKINHDQSHCLNEQPAKLCQINALDDHLSPSINVDSNTYSEIDILKDHSLMAQQRFELEEQTRTQVSSDEWHEKRSHRITGSKCGWILNRKKRQ